MAALLPDPLPSDPLPLVERWLAEATAVLPNAAAMALATVAPDGRPTARMVICRGLDTRAGWLAFYTDRESPKALALTARPLAATIFHWEAFERQIRVEGPVVLAPDTASDAYWASRPPEARVAATVSRQSRPLGSRAELVARFERERARLSSQEVARPARWGGYRLWAERVELWAGQPARLHDRALWSRRLEPDGGGYKGGPWTVTRLEP